MKRIHLKTIACLPIYLIAAFAAFGQPVVREFSNSAGGEIRVVNYYGRVRIFAAEENEKTVLSFENAAESEVASAFVKSRLEIEVQPNDPGSRIDIALRMPERMRVVVETSGGEVNIAGNLESVDVRTDTGTITADIPLDDVKYNFVWRSSKPRVMSDVELAAVKEKAAGKFVIKGTLPAEPKPGQDKRTAVEDEKKDDHGTLGSNPESTDEGKKDDSQKLKESGRIELDFVTARGIILLNVSPDSVPSDLRQRPLTEAAKAIVRSGDSILTEAIRRASPKYFGDYSKTLPPFKSEPSLNPGPPSPAVVNGTVKKVLVKVTDYDNRAVANLSKSDFDLTERGDAREIISVEPATTPFNLVLLTDVSGSVDNYVEFIRKAARNFVNTVSPEDRIAIIIFNDDIQVLSNFTTDKARLSESLDSFGAGGGTAYFDALAFVLAETLRPLKGERTGIVVLSDGDDTRSFLPFDSLLGAIQESGALIYPLYVPTGLIAASRGLDPEQASDPLRNRYIGLTSKAEAEGEKLAQVSGGVYYPIRQLDELQKAYDDIVLQLRTAYSITFRSDLAESGGGRASPRLKVKVKRENTFVKVGSVVEVAEAADTITQDNRE